MKKLQCELCDSIEITKIDNDTFQCQHCGCKYTLEQARNLIGHTVETTIGYSELNRLVENANNKIKFKQHADDTIDKIMNEFPAEHYGYWLYIENYFNQVIEQKNIEPFDFTLDKIIEKYKVLLKIAETSSKINEEQVKNFWDINIRKIYDELMIGEIKGLDRIHPNIIDSISLFKKAYDTGMNNARILKANDLFGNGKSITIYGHIPDFVLGKVFCYSDDFLHLHCNLILDKPVGIITPGNITQIKKAAYEYTYNEVIKTRKCPICNAEMYNSFFGNKLTCSKCKWSVKLK